MPIFKNTWYTNGKGKSHPANVKIHHQNPTDTLITVSPEGGTSRKIKLMGPKSEVYKFTGQDGYVRDLDYEDYWIPRGREALKNRKSDDKLNFGEQILRFLGLFQQGGTISKEQQEELSYALLGYVIATKKQPKDEAEMTQLVQALIQLKQQDPEQYNQLVQLGMQKQTVKAKYGSKLNYVKKLKGKCPKGQELKQEGGKMVCVPCMKKALGKQQGGVMLGPNEDYTRRVASNQRHANISKQYFNQAPSLPNLAKGVYHWFMAKPYLGGEDESLIPPETGVAPMPGKWADVKNLWKTVKSLGNWGKLPKFKPGYRGTKTYEGGYGAQQGNLYLSNSAKVGGGPSNVDDLEQLVIKNLQDDVAKGRIPSEYQLEKAIKQRLNNLYRLSDDDIVELRNFSEGNEKLFESRLMQLIKGHTGRTFQGTR